MTTTPPRPEEARTMQKHFVTFFSPGTFMAETTEKEIDSWDVDRAVEMARGITERHGARPYGFHFTTRERGETDFVPKETRRSGVYYLGGRVRTLDEVEADNDPIERVLRQNMRSNGWFRVVTNDNSWRWTQPLREGDIVLDVAL